MLRLRITALTYNQNHAKCCGYASLLSPIIRIMQNSEDLVEGEFWEQVSCPWSNNMEKLAEFTSWEIWNIFVNFYFYTFVLEYFMGKMKYCRAKWANAKICLNFTFRLFCERNFMLTLIYTFAECHSLYSTQNRMEIKYGNLLDTDR